MFPSLGCIGDIIEIPGQEPIQKNVCEILILFPGTPEVIEPAPMWKKSVIKPATHSNPAAGKKEISSGYPPRYEHEYPRPKYLGQQNKKAIEYSLHGR
jgi:hypothetical protein